MRFTSLGIVTLLAATSFGLPMGEKAPRKYGSHNVTPETSYAIVDTGQDRCFGAGVEVEFPSAGQDFGGQDAQYAGNAPSYLDNGDGTVTDQVTGLEWQKTPDLSKFTQEEAEAYVRKLRLGGHTDWRLPTIKELFSLADFRGDMHTKTPYIDTDAFGFHYPVAIEGEGGAPGQRDMDAQYATSTNYLGTTMGRDESAFGFNFADGRIKSYPLRAERYVRAVRGNKSYGENDFVSGKNGTVTDRATGLVWMQADSAKTMDWRQALEFAEGLEFAGHDDWRLPTVKELQSIVDYDKAPDARRASDRGPAIDSVFTLTENESWAWSSTTHIENQGAYYVCFGQSFSVRTKAGKKINAHGAGAVRSDPKVGDPTDWPEGLGPQADEIRIYNYVRCVRSGAATPVTEGPALKEASAGRRPSFNGGPESSPASGFMKRLDKDGDGRVSRDEFDRPDRRFDDLDRDGDGYIDSSEAPTGKPGAGREARALNSEDTLSVTTVGTGSPLYNKERSSPSALITMGDTRILVDMGEGTSQQLSQASITAGSIDAFCFTHHHRDHNADAMSLLPTAWSRGNSAPVFGPEGTEALVDFLTSFYAEDLTYRSEGKRRQETGAVGSATVHTLPLAKPVVIDDVTITTAEVSHTIETFAYRFDAGGKSIVISGDLSYSEGLVDLAKGADLLVIDSGGIAYEGEEPPKERGAKKGNSAKQPAHSSMEEIASMAASADVKALLLTHFRTGEVDEELTRERLAKTYTGLVLFAADMQTYRAE